MFMNRDTKTILNFIEKFNGNINVDEENTVAKSYWFARILYDRFGYAPEDVWKYIYFDNVNEKFFCKIDDNFFDVYGLHSDINMVKSLYEIYTLDKESCRDIYSIVMMQEEGK